MDHNRKCYRSPPADLLVGSKALSRPFFRQKCTLVIGGHSLEGTVVLEKRHLAILKKRKREDPRHGAEGEAVCAGEKG